MKSDKIEVESQKCFNGDTTYRFRIEANNIWPYHAWYKANKHLLVLGNDRFYPTSFEWGILTFDSNDFGVRQTMRTLDYLSSPKWVRWLNPSSE